MHNALLPLLRLILSFGMRGDYNRLRRLALRCPLFRPLHFLYCVFHGSVLPLGAAIGGPVRFPHEPTGVFLSTRASSAAAAPSCSTSPSVPTL